MAAAYSIGLRKRVVREWDACGDADTVAAKYDVSREWVYQLIRRRRQTGSLAPRQANFPALTTRKKARLAALIMARPNATLAELRDALGTTATLMTLWRAINRLGFIRENGIRRRAAGQAPTLLPH